MPCWRRRWSRRCRPGMRWRPGRAPARRSPLAALAAETFILYRRPLGPGLYDAIIAACQRAGYSPNIGQEAPRMLATLSLVAAGLGVTLVPQSMRRLRVHGVAYRPLDRAAGAGGAAQPGLPPRRDLAAPHAVSSRWSARAGHPAPSGAALRSRRRWRHSWVCSCCCCARDTRPLRANGLLPVRRGLRGPAVRLGIPEALRDRHRPAEPVPSAVAGARRLRLRLRLPGVAPAMTTTAALVEAPAR